MDRWFVVVNPVAGRGRGLRDWPIISKNLRDNGINYDAVFTEKKYHATELAVEAANLGYRKIVAVGGDGTLHEVVHGLFLQQVCEPKEITIAVIAVGTGNDWIRMYGIPRKISEAVTAIVVGKTFLQDVAKVDYFEAFVPQTRYMANVAGVGFDAVVNRKYNRLKERGIYGGWLYIISLILSVFDYKSLQFKVSVDNREILSTRVFTAAIGIGKFNGGGMQQVPNAVADDGLLDMTIIKKINNLSVFRYIKRLFNGTIYDIPQSAFYRGAEINIESSPETPLEIDGEALGFSPITFTVLPRAINVIII